jgi:hypothetical protein
MVRTDLTKLLGVADAPATSGRAERTTPGRGLPSAASTRQPSDRVVPTPEPLYLSYQRKEARLREEQQKGLTLLARRLSRAKGSGGERITENTLIRVAVDLLLARSAQLAGNDEAALRNSLDLP